MFNGKNALLQQQFYWHSPSIAVAIFNQYTNYF